jgi:hypothetical protein
MIGLLVLAAATAQPVTLACNLDSTQGDLIITANEAQSQISYTVGPWEEVRKATFTATKVTWDEGTETHTIDRVTLKRTVDSFSRQEHHEGTCRIVQTPKPAF